MKRRKSPQYDLKLKYQRTVEVSLIISLMLIASLFIASKKIDYTRVEIAPPVITELEAVDIPITEQRERLPEPARPKIPYADDNPDLPDDVTIPINDNWKIPLELPPLMEIKDVDFFAVEVKPVLIGGEEAILSYIIENDLYPEMARVAGVGGKVIIEFTVNPKGIPVNISVFQERPADLGFGKAGIEAIQNMRFKPGKQRDKAVPVRMKQTIIFNVR